MNEAQMNEAQMNEAQMNEAQMNNRNELWKKQSSSCLFICHGARPFPGGRALSDPWGAHSKTACRGRAPSQESAPLLRRARPLSRGRALFSCKGLFQMLLTGGALFLRRARPFSGERAPSQEGKPFLPRRLIQKLTKPKLDTTLHEKWMQEPGGWDTICA